MIRFFINFLKTRAAMGKSSFTTQGIKGVYRANSSLSGGPSFRFFKYLLRRRLLVSSFKTLLGSQAVLLAITSLGFLVFSGIDSQIKGRWEDFKWPFSFETVSATITVVFMVNFGWTLLILLNHYSDLVSLFNTVDSSS